MRWKWMSLAVLLALLATGAVAVTAQGGAGPSVADEASAAASRIAAALPAAATGLAPDGAGGYRVQIQEPIADLLSQLPAAAPSDPDADLYAAAETGWKAQMATMLALDQAPDVTALEVAPAGGSVSPVAANFLHQTVRMAPGEHAGFDLQRSGSVSQADARRQLASNLAVLAGALPPDTLQTQRVTTIPLDPAAGRFALQVDLGVHAIAVLQDHLGDLLAGLPTGLVGDASATVEGLAIVVTDDAGQRIGSWQSARNGNGSMLWSRAIALPPTLTTTATFPNLIDGPPTSASASGGPISAAAGG